MENGFGEEGGFSSPGSGEADAFAEAIWGAQMRAVEVFLCCGCGCGVCSGLRKCAVGKPVVIEETFPLSCSPIQEQTFLLQSRAIACGWLGHYAGKAIAQYKVLAWPGKLSIAQALNLAWQRMFVRLGPRFVNSQLKPVKH